jgi:hypothetical protein
VPTSVCPIWHATCLVSLAVGSAERPVQCDATGLVPQADPHTRRIGSMSGRSVVELSPVVASGEATGPGW